MSESLPTAVIGYEWVGRLVYEGNEPLSFNVSGLPDWVTVTEEANTLVLTGVPSSTGDFSFTVIATDSTGSAFTTTSHTVSVIDVGELIAEAKTYAEEACTCRDESCACRDDSCTCRDESCACRDESCACRDEAKTWAEAAMAAANSLGGAASTAGQASTNAQEYAEEACTCRDEACTCRDEACACRDAACECADNAAASADAAAASAKEAAGYADDAAASAKEAAASATEAKGYAEDAANSASEAADSATAAAASAAEAAESAASGGSLSIDGVEERWYYAYYTDSTTQTTTNTRGETVSNTFTSINYRVYVPGTEGDGYYWIASNNLSYTYYYTTDTGSSETGGTTVKATGALALTNRIWPSGTLAGTLSPTNTSGVSSQWVIWIRLSSS